MRTDGNIVKHSPTRTRRSTFQITLRRGFIYDLQEFEISTQILNLIGLILIYTGVTALEILTES